MNERYYRHESGLKFGIARLMDEEEKSSYGITAILLWLPNCTTDPMLIIGWYIGEYDEAQTAAIVNNWLINESIDELKALQDLPDELK